MLFFDVINPQMEKTTDGSEIIKKLLQCFRQERQISDVILQTGLEKNWIHSID